MRVPFNYHNNLIDQLNRLNQQQWKAQRELASGQKVRTVADDPVVMDRALLLNTEKSRIQTYARNLDRARGVAEFSMDTLDQINKISSAAIDAANRTDGMTSTIDYRLRGGEIDQLLEQAVRMGNAQFAGDHVFGGGQTGEAPFVIHRYAEGDPQVDSQGDPVLGENGDPVLAGPHLFGRISYVEYTGTTAPEADVAFRVGEGHQAKPFQRGEANAALGDFFNELVAVRDALYSEDQDLVSLSLPALEVANTSIMSGMLEFGVTLRGFELTESMNRSRFEQAERQTSRELDADLVETIVRLNQLQTAYEAALDSSSRMLRLSLLDFIN